MNNLTFGKNYIKAIVTDSLGCYAISPWVKLNITHFPIDDSVCRLFPNPSDDGSFTFSLKEPLPIDSRVVIVDLTGRIVHGFQWSRDDLKERKLNLTFLETGLYYIYFQNDENYIPCEAKNMRPLIVKNGDIL